MEKVKVAIAEGDGVGPEVMAAVLHVLEEAGANLDYHTVELKEGILPATWDTLQNSAALLKGPTGRDLRNSICSRLALYAHLCPCASYAPFIPTSHPKMDLILIHETFNGAMEYRQTHETYEVVKTLFRPELEKIIRLAFDYARTHGRKKIGCFTRDNLLKLTDGLFHQMFDAISAEYTDIASEHWLTDIAAGKLAGNPEYFEVIVLPSLYGEILTPLAAQLTGSPALIPSASVGDHFGLFEALHSSASKKAGQNLANPSGLLLAAVMLLNHLGHHEVAERIHNAWLKTIEEGIHPYDIYNEGVSKQRAGTKEFASAVVKFLGQKPQRLKRGSYKSSEKLKALVSKAPKQEKRSLVGVDLFLHSQIDAEALIEKLRSIPTPVSLQYLTGSPDQYCARFTSKQKGEGISPDLIPKTLQLIGDEGFDIIRTENLYAFDGSPGF